MAAFFRFNHGVVQQKKPVGSTQPPSTLLDDLLAYWKLDDVSGPAYDATSTTEGAVMRARNNAYFLSAGVCNSGVNFSPTDAMLYCTSTSLLNPTGDEYTISAWINYNLTGYDRTIFRGSLSSAPYNNLHIYINSWANAISFAVETSTGSAGYDDDTRPLSANTWYHVVCVAPGIGGKPRIYLNDVSTESDQTQTETLVHANGEYVIGNAYDGAGAQFGGNIDEIGVWDRVLTEAEIAELYNSGKGLSYPFTDTDPCLGGYIIGNTQFSYNDIWTIDSGRTTIEDGVAKFRTTDTYSTLLYQEPIDISINRSYRMEFDVCTYVGGNVRWTMGTTSNPNGNNNENHQAVGHYIEDVSSTVASAERRLTWYSYAAPGCTSIFIDNVIFRRIYHW